MDTLSDILSDEPIAEPVVEQIAAEPVETPEAKAERDEKGRFAPKGEEPSASPAPVDEPAFDHAAVKGERERRQKAEQRARELEQQLQALQQPPAPPVSIWEDDAAWQQQFGGQVVTTAVGQATQQSRLIMSEMMASQAFPDFADVRESLVQMLNDHPELNEQVANDPHPWAKAYQIAQTRKTMAEVGATDVESLKAKIREELKAEMAAAAPAINLPQSLADAQSSRASVGMSQPLTLHEIIHGKGP